MLRGSAASRTRLRGRYAQGCEDGAATLEKPDVVINRNGGIVLIVFHRVSRVCAARHLGLAPAPVLFVCPNGLGAVPWAVGESLPDGSRRREARVPL